MPRKAGFWIKKDGKIAVDTSMDKKLKEKEERLKFNAMATPKTRQTYSIRGKGQKFLREVHIPTLNKKIRNLWVYLHLWKKHVLTVEAKANEQVKEVKRRERAHRRVVFARKERTVRKKAIRCASAMERGKVSKYALNNRVKYYGHFYMIIVDRFLEQKNIKKEFFNLLMVSTYQKIVEPHIYYMWSVVGSEDTSKVRTKYLCNKGWLQRLSGKRGKFVLTLKALNFIQEFDDFYDQEAKKQSDIVKNAKRNKNSDTKTLKVSRRRNRIADEKPTGLC